MKSKTLAEVRKALSALATQKSGAEFTEAADAYLKSVLVVDEKGDPVEVDATLLADSAQKSVDAAPDNDAIEKSIRKAIADELAEFRKSMPPRESAPTVRVVGHRYGPLKNFKGTVNDRTADERAYRFGVFLAAAAGRPWAVERAKSIDLTITKTHQEKVNETGGFLVPPEFGRDLIDNRLMYGVCRRIMRTEPMTSDTKTQPRRRGGLTASFVGESVPGSESTSQWDQVQWTAKKLMVLARASNELVEDAIISIGDNVAGEIAWAFAEKEDSCGINGTGTSAFGGIVGLRPKLASAAGGYPSAGAFTGGIFKAATATTVVTVTIGDLTAMAGRLPTYSRANARWLVHPSVAHTLLARLSLTLGGSAVGDFSDPITPRALGYPIELSEQMPSITSGADNIFVLFGDFTRSSGFGDRRMTTISVSDSANGAFEQDEIVIRGTERFDIVNHDMGDATDPGAVVGLVLTS